MSKNYTTSKDNRHIRHVTSLRGAEFDKEMKQVVDRSVAALENQMEKIFERYNRPTSKKTADVE
ncbi:hypothetical protein [Methylobacterium isbiliense]|jgi:hypothetical protein|uniref:Uncharacterized protein n=1 Tax=Methylobacterium isbiliense TaxID=315478 RepID=A0ABQ4S7A8_9HYPH|nr:hypothetical protein [Methylobacterium isbiliense]MDN3622836.1 hypothetical protein [Methylobacterium isbiliense]GJD98359.1 hypothetical protein GMJLKIPL_0266 [Methylobacterium isbiliense]